MLTFANLTDARLSLMAFYASELQNIPEDMRGRLGALVGSPSPVDQIVRTGELLYARRLDLPTTAWELAGGLIGFATINAWHGLLDDERGDRIVQALRRDLGETPPAGMSFPDPADDPAPRAEYAAPAAQPAVPGEPTP